MKKIFVSGCYDILHAGHIQYFQEARALGDHLTVCFASSEVLWTHKERKPSLPDDHKKAVLESLSMVDEVVMGENTELGLDFKDHFLRIKPDILAVTVDDNYADIKKELCNETGTEYLVLEKTPPVFKPISTTELVKFIRAPAKAPLRVDFAGGWLDVPRFARDGAFIVNCSISPTVSLQDWSYEKQSGLGGSGAYALLMGDRGIDEEIDLGVGWQDPAVICETGLCVWRSGQQPVLDFKQNGDMLQGRMALWWSGIFHDTPALAERERDFNMIQEAGAMARQAVLDNDLNGLASAVGHSYEMQCKEGMDPLPEISTALAAKYCGGGWGGYAVFLFPDQNSRDLQSSEEGWMLIEPYTRFA